eukprot:g23821.t1
MITIRCAGALLMSWCGSMTPMMTLMTWGRHPVSSESQTNSGASTATGGELVGSFSLHLFSCSAFRLLCMAQKEGDSQCRVHQVHSGRDAFDLSASEVEDPHHSMPTPSCGSGDAMNRRTSACDEKAPLLEMMVNPICDFHASAKRGKAAQAIEGGSC